MRKIVVPWLPSVYAGRTTRAITLAPFVLVVKEYENNAAILAHEQVHLDQVREMGWWTFYWKYATDIGFRKSVEAVGYAKQREVENA